MRNTLMLSASAVALMLLAAPADAGRNQCYAFQIGSMQFDCNHDRPDGHGGVPDFSRPEPPDDSDDDDSEGGDGDGDGDHDCKDGGGKGGKY